MKLGRIASDMDAEDYNTLFEKKPGYLKDILAALRDGKTPDEIGAKIRRMRPHKWQLSKIVEGAARYMEREGVE
jgi:hypothetical protein